MDLLRSVVFVTSTCSLFTSIKGDRYYISDTETTWANAVNSNECILASPKVKFTTGAILEELGVTINEDVWIGYYEARTALEYIGCAKNDGTTPVIYTKSDPGQCMSACMNSKMIGIQDNKCYCYGTTAPQHNITNPYCNMRCGEKSVDKLLCGRLSSYISLYRRVNSAVDSTDAENNEYCLHYSLQKLIWGDCDSDSYIQIICESGDNFVWIYTPDYVHSSFYWSVATTKCFDLGAIPSTYNGLQTFKTNVTSPLLTGVVRSQVIQRIDSNNNHEGAMEFGYIKLSKGILEFKTTRDQRKQLKRLCVQTTTETTESSTAHHNTTPQRTTTPSETTKSTYEPSKGHQPNESSDVGAIVGATLTIVVLIAIAIVAVIYVRKRGFALPPFLKKEKREPPPSNANNNNAYVISRPVEILQSSYKSDPDTYAEIDLTTTSYNEGNKGGATDKPQVGDDEEDASPYSHDYFVSTNVDEGEYDTTKDADQTKIPKPNPNTFNPYNKLNFEQSSNYDHIGTSKGANAKRHVSDSENTYNTTYTGYLKKSIGKTDNDFDTADGTEYDTYNHTNIQGHQKGLGTSENDYDAI